MAIRKYKNGKLSGTTLIEVVIALALIATIFVIGSRLWIQAVVAHAPKRSFEIRTFMRSVLMEEVREEDIGKVTASINILNKFAPSLIGEDKSFGYY
ncbi:MAG: hypothetical protein R3B93_19095 [Bacteroidia bacterium]